MLSWVESVVDTLVRVLTEAGLVLRVSSLTGVDGLRACCGRWFPLLNCCGSREGDDRLPSQVPVRLASLHHNTLPSWCEMSMRRTTVIWMCRDINGKVDVALLFAVEEKCPNFPA